MLALRQRAPESGELIPQNERELRHPEGAACSYGCTPTVRGSSASSTNEEL